MLQSYLKKNKMIEYVCRDRTCIISQIGTIFIYINFHNATIVKVMEVLFSVNIFNVEFTSIYIFKSICKGDLG